MRRLLVAVLALLLLLLLSNASSSRRCSFFVVVVVPFAPRFLSAHTTEVVCAPSPLTWAFSEALRAHLAGARKGLHCLRG